MNRILIVGHPASGCGDVVELLHQCGMQSAQPSRRDGLLPQDITATLCKVHNAAPIETVVEEHDFKQIEVGPVWHGMALDLMLGNLDQPLWGWSDPNSIYALDYWSDLDPKLTFVLVYDEPHRVLMEAAKANAEPPTDSDVERMLDNWTAYNGALVRFFLRHPSRCLLVSAQQVRRAVDAYLQQLQPLLDAPLALKNTLAVADEHLQDALVEAGETAEVCDSPAAASAEEPVSLPSSMALAIADLGMAPRDAATLMNIASAERYLVDGMLASHPAAQQLYAELQSVANLPLDRPTRPHGDPAVAWAALVRQRTFFTDLVENIHDEYLRVHEELDQTLEKAKADAAETQLQIAQLTARADAGEQLAKAHEHENELLLSQLQHVKEELLRQRLHKQELEQRRQEIEHELLCQAAEVKAALESERGAREKMGADHSALDRKVKELGNENELLLSQLHLLQEELERHYLRKQELEQRGDEIEREMQRRAAEARAALEKEKAAAKRAMSELRQQHEEYAKQMADGVAKSKSETEGVAKELSDAQQKLDARAKQLAAVQAQLETEKATRAQACAEKAVLDSRLKNLGGENDLLLSQLHQVQEELERYFLDNQRLKEALSPPAPHGAALRVKRQLNYRLGATMIQRSRSVRGWLGMPWALAAEARAFRQERSGGAAEELPPLHTYRDVHEAERVKQHLSYQLGSVLLKHGRSPVGWIKLPFALRSEVKRFRQSRREAG